MQPQPMITFNLYLAFECKKKKKRTPDVLLEGQPLLEFVVFELAALRDRKKNGLSLKRCEIKCLLLLLGNRKMLGQYLVNMNVLISSLLCFQSITNKSNDAS